MFTDGFFAGFSGHPRLDQANHCWNKADHDYRYDDKLKVRLHEG
jgi:hypothetical protein